MHCLLTSMFLQVLGPGLALNGPVGSMAKAAEGMRKEINHIFVAFLIMICGFACSCVFSFWTVMNRKAAYVATGFFTLSSVLWWRHCSRIYNRFKYEKTDFHAEFDDDARFNNEQMQQHGVAGESALDREFSDDSTVVNPLSKSAAANKGAPSRESSIVPVSKSGVSSDNNSSVRRRPSATSTVTANTQNIRGSSTSIAHSTMPSPTRSSASVAAGAGAGVGAGVDGIMMKGYLTRRDTVSNKNFFGGTNKLNSSKYVWNRRYFVVTTRGRMFSFKSPQHYLSFEAASSQNRHDSNAFTGASFAAVDRPIELSWYTAEAYQFVNTDAVARDSGEELVYEMRLEYADKDDQGIPIVFRCDTSNELNEWMTVITAYTAYYDENDNDDNERSDSDGEVTTTNTKSGRSHPSSASVA
jgi:hypothetical protein